MGGSGYIKVKVQRENCEEKVQAEMAWVKLRVLNKEVCSAWMSRTYCVKLCGGGEDYIQSWAEFQPSNRKQMCFFYDFFFISFF